MSQAASTHTTGVSRDTQLIGCGTRDTNVLCWPLQYYVLHVYKYIYRYTHMRSAVNVIL